MLREPTISLGRRAALTRRVQRNNVGLRIALAMISVVYVVVPTVLQWVALEADRVAVRAEAVAVTPTTVLSEEARGASKPLVDLIVPFVPERFREYVPAGIRAITGGGDHARSTAAIAAAAALRASVILCAATLAVVVGIRMGRPYRPRHARPGSISRMFV